ncbi:hypothetical protein SAMN02745172_02471 [Pseudoxanthobacter soli DSM 19599]|uniref:GpW protein n=1 Tax=Pseudoxanthobacter soli DSM 19599 TaxID=1123029 RepID=A0A1M7ZLP9_9HYPH|nr:hypothetical protein [Pseudoxanthobacter soli]SHO65824.1 hypothetical protein SAMN02745172_02471 [Pseudoxanthobacter soli DSM 19599]
MSVDWTNPCARAAALRTAYFELLSGAGEVSIRHRSGETDREVSFAASDLGRLRQEMQSAEDACLVVSGRAPIRRRGSISAGRM